MKKYFSLVAVVLLMISTAASASLVVHEFSTTVGAVDLDDSILTNLGFTPVTLGDSIYGRVIIDTNTIATPVSPGGSTDNIAIYNHSISDGFFLQIGTNTVSSSSYVAKVYDGAAPFGNRDGITFSANNIFKDTIKINGSPVGQYDDDDLVLDDVLIDFAMVFYSKLNDALTSTTLSESLDFSTWGYPDFTTFSSGLNACLGDCFNPFATEPLVYRDSLGWTIEPSNISSTVVPIPAAVWLFGSGLLGLVGVARRKSRA